MLLRERVIKADIYCALRCIFVLDTSTKLSLAEITLV